MGRVDKAGGRGAKSWEPVGLGVEGGTQASAQGRAGLQGVL